MIALTCTKDVQDAILTLTRSGAQWWNVICFRYWWQTGRGLFAPHGGQNLSPRQIERTSKGGTPTDEDLAGMAMPYRLRFPDKGRDRLQAKMSGCAGHGHFFVRAVRCRRCREQP